MNRLLASIILILALLSCEKEEKNEPAGEAILSSQLFGTGPYFVNGFSFVEGREVKYPGGDVKPDMVLLSKKNNAGEITEAYIESPDNPEAFSLAGEFESHNPAETFFREFTEVQQAEYTTIADSVRAHQVWIIKTRSGKYAKILTTEIIYFQEGAFGSYVEMGFQWEFQPDGTKFFTRK